MSQFTEALSNILTAIDDFVWGPVMLILLVGTGIFLTIRTKALCWRNLPYAVSNVLSKEARQKKGDGDVSPFSALTTALAATIGTGNIVGVATAMVSGGPGALVWMWISAAFGITSKFSECMLAIKYREVNERGEMSGGPMYTMKKALKHKKLGAVLGWFFALFAVFASFGIGNLTQANSISTALTATYNVPSYITGIIITILALVIIIGGIKSISKVSQVVVPLMAVFYIVAGLAVIIGNISNIPTGIVMIFKMAFSVKAVGGGLCGSIVASMMQGLRFGVARGVFSNEAGMGSAAITAAAATTTDPVRQGYINMTGTFWDTIVVCTITGLCIASSGVLGMTDTYAQGSYSWQNENLVISSTEEGSTETLATTYTASLNGDKLTLKAQGKEETLTLTRNDKKQPKIKKEDSLSITENSNTVENSTDIIGVWNDTAGNDYIFDSTYKYQYRKLVEGSALTIKAFETVLGGLGGTLITIAITLFAFSTILGWEYHGEKALEYLLGTHRYNMVYRIFFSLLAYFGATTTLQIAWTFSDIANALMAIPNLICMLALSGVIKREMERYQPILKAEKEKKRLRKWNN
ncbi:MAG: sodium:alanine symporter family protein [Lachnospiraceae bacterium]|jgi:AGCS family alanine or glycine:cation symporter|nr:sodium:alanine symporter family protein [Lachnospiraceae bacterium]